MLGLLIFLAIIVLATAAVWKSFQKAGQPGWASLVPIYNLVVLCKIAGKPTWWVWLLIFVPIVNIVLGVKITHAISKRFGFGVGMTLMLLFIGIVGWSIIGFGEAKYDASPAAA